MNYQEFLEGKVRRVTESGFDIDESKLNHYLFPFQKFIVKRALKAGKYALFEDCGLGKTIQQLEWAHHVQRHTKKPVLILCPLAVSGQTIQEGIKFGIEVHRYPKGERRLYRAQGLLWNDSTGLRRGRIHLSFKDYDLERSRS